MANKRIFVSFPEQDENLRDLLVDQSKNTNSPFDFTDMSVHKPWDNAWKTFDTYGPWKLIGGLAKKHPNENDFANYSLFIKNLQIKE